MNDRDVIQVLMDAGHPDWIVIECELCEWYTVVPRVEPEGTRALRGHAHETHGREHGQIRST